MSAKICMSCKHPKSLDQFGNNRSRKDGKQDYCLVCHRAASRMSKAATRAAPETASEGPRESLLMQLEAHKYFRRTA